eukprot:g12527.t1
MLVNSGVGTFDARQGYVHQQHKDTTRMAKKLENVDDSEIPYVPPGHPMVCQRGNCRGFLNPTNNKCTRCFGEALPIDPDNAWIRAGWKKPDIKI